VSLALAAGAATILAAGSAPKPAPKGGAQPRAISMHLGIADFAFIGQSYDDLLKRLPQAKVEPFSGQPDVLVAKAPGAGISCFVAGDTPQELKVVSVGFNFDGVYEGVEESGYRTSEGIGKGSTVNDLLETYGRAEITGNRATNPTLRRGKPQDDPDAPKKYQYASPDGTIKTYFVVQGSRVLRMVINHLAPLDKHLLKRPPQR
jgi:hypothetical protein